MFLFPSLLENCRIDDLSIFVYNVFLLVIEHLLLHFALGFLWFQFGQVQLKGWVLGGAVGLLCEVSIIKGLVKRYDGSSGFVKG